MESQTSNQDKLLENNGECRNFIYPFQNNRIVHTVVTWVSPPTTPRVLRNYSLIFFSILQNFK